VNVTPLKAIIPQTITTKHKRKSGGKGLGRGLNTFNPERKSLFLALITKYWPNVYKTCEEIGINPVTYYNHLHSDPAFALAVENIKRARIQKIETSVMNAAEDSKNFLHQAMVLRAYMPETYDRAKVVKVEGYKMQNGEQAQRMTKLDGAIDAQIVNAYSTRKERQQQRRLARGGTPPAITQGEEGSDGKA
jgi:hypothetical protein